MLSILLLSGFIEYNSYSIITKKDIELNIPKGFPKPVYNFKENKITPEGFMLGRKLFYDPILSKDNFTSCASCHQQFAAFAHIDHALSHGIAGKIGKRNVPALQNLIWSNSFMWDGGINHLDLQPLAPMTCETEMGETLENILVKLQSDSLYPKLFYAAFKDSVITTTYLTKSLSQFVALMISSDAKYDKVISGKENFSDNEMNGLKLFRRHCANCHQEPLFTDNSFRNNGLNPDSTLMDKGYGAISGIAEENYKFKVPSLRNVEMTYPYMHDGRFKNLNQVMNHYSNGKYYTDNYDKSIERNKNLSDKDKANIIAFLKTLTDKTFLYDRRFADPSYRN